MKTIKSVILLIAACIFSLYSCDVLEKENVVPESFKDVEASKDEFSTTQGKAVVLDFLKNDKIKAGALLSLGEALYGKIKKETDRKFIYYPDSSFIGTDSVAYKICLGAKCDSGVIIIKIKHPKDTVQTDTCSIVAKYDYVATAPGASVQIQVLNNDSICGSILKFSIVTQPTYGKAVKNAQGIITYTPNNGFTGSDSLRYQVCQGNNCAEALVSISVSDSLSTCDFYLTSDTLMVYNNDTIQSDTSNTTTYQLDVLYNDNLCQGLQRFEITSNGSHGYAFIQDNMLYYTVTNGQTFEDVLSYKVCINKGGTLVCKEALVNIRRLE